MIKLFLLILIFSLYACTASPRYTSGTTPKKNKTAKKLLLKALEIEPNEPNILFSLAECYQNTGDKEEAKNLSALISSTLKQNAFIIKH